jgi:hypothetical protein
MRLSIPSATAALALISSAYAGLTAKDIVVNINVLTAKSQALIKPAQSLSIFTVVQTVPVSIFTHTASHYSFIYMLILVVATRRWIHRHCCYCYR